MFPLLKDSRQIRRYIRKDRAILQCILMPQLGVSVYHASKRFFVQESIFRDRTKGNITLIQKFMFNIVCFITQPSIYGVIVYFFSMA